MTESEGMPLSEVLFGNELPRPALSESELADALAHWLAETRRRTAGQRSFRRTRSTQTGTAGQQAPTSPPHSDRSPAREDGAGP